MSVEYAPLESFPIPGTLYLVTIRGRGGEHLVRIVRNNPKNTVAVLEDGSEISGPHRTFRKKAPAGTVFTSTAPKVEKENDYHYPGTVVRFKPGTSMHLKAGNALHVVAANSSDKRGVNHRVFPLGGSQRYWTKIMASDLIEVPVESINR